MVPSLSVHVAAARVKVTVSCPHWVACLAKKHRKAGTIRRTSVLVAVSSRREWFWLLTRFASRKWRSGLNGISHPDWVKFSVELNSAPKQNTRFSSSLQISWKENYQVNSNLYLVLLLVLYSLFVLCQGKREVVPYCSRQIFGVSWLAIFYMMKYRSISCQLKGYFRMIIYRNFFIIEPLLITLGITLNIIWWWGSSSRDRGSVEYSFIAITPWFTKTRSGRTC